MILDFCNKLGCKLKKIIKSNPPTDVNESIENMPSNGVPTPTVEQQSKVVENNKSISINIHRPVCEYAHGKKFKSRPTWIVVHYTACINVSAKSMCKAMKNNTGASSHFYIDENDIYSAVPEEYISWHVGTGECKQPEAYKKMSLKDIANYKANDWRYDLAAKNHLKWQSEGCDFTGNNCSIGVDLCVRKKSSATKKATDNDWYFTEGAIDNTAKTVAYLANKYNIDDSHIITHCMATGKLCPQPFVWPPEVGDKEWESFKAKVSEYRKHGIIAKLV